MTRLLLKVRGGRRGVGGEGAERGTVEELVDDFVVAFSGLEEREERKEISEGCESGKR